MFPVSRNFYYLTQTNLLLTQLFTVYLMASGHSPTHVMELTLPPSMTLEHLLRPLNKLNSCVNRSKLNWMQIVIPLHLVQTYYQECTALLFLWSPGKGNFDYATITVTAILLSIP